MTFNMLLLLRSVLKYKIMHFSYKMIRFYKACDYLLSKVSVKHTTLCHDIKHRIITFLDRVIAFHCGI